MKKKQYIIFIFSITLLFYKEIKAQNPAPINNQLKAPIWVSSRPNNGFKFVGIGFAEKDKGGNYQMEAKKNALYDLASEIKVDISSNSVLYTIQNNNNFNQNFNSLIKLSNTDNIEGYILVDSYENEKQYWVYYQLDKEEYANQKAKKKQQIISKACNLISASFSDEINKDFTSSLKKRIHAFGILTPYLSEEINFEVSQSKGLKNIFDLTGLIQNQLQSISVANQKTVQVLKPYQQIYAPLVYRLELNSKTPLQNFPLLVSSDEEKITINEKTATNSSGELQLKVNTVEPLNQYVSFSLSPDIITLMGTDSIGSIGVRLLKQFIQTSSLKVQANVTRINIYVNSKEQNFGNPTRLNAIEEFIKQKFIGQEINIIDKPTDADFIIESLAETKEDLSSYILSQTFNIKLASLSINLQLKNGQSGNVLYSSIVSDVYGYANSLENAGINSYASPKLNAKLAEALFFLKRKILVY